MSKALFLSFGTAGWFCYFAIINARTSYSFVILQLTNGYASPVPHVLNRKMDLQWKPQSNRYKKFSHLYYMK